MNGNDKALRSQTPHPSSHKTCSCVESGEEILVHAILELKELASRFRIHGDVFRATAIERFVQEYLGEEQAATKET